MSAHQVRGQPTRLLTTSPSTLCMILTLHTGA
jgi:hypothetical protein